MIWLILSCGALLGLCAYLVRALYRSRREVGIVRRGADSIVNDAAKLAREVADLSKQIEVLKNEREKIKPVDPSISADGAAGMFDALNGR